MRPALKLHPDSRSHAITGIEMSAVRQGSNILSIRYFAEGAISGVRLPRPAAPGRADNLWKQTSFQAFISAPTGEAYCEFNFSPSTSWAAYAFTSHRAGGAPIELAKSPFVEILAGDNRFELYALLDLEGVAELPPRSLWHVGLSAIIQEASGNRSYWALAHPPGAPDFHHADGFTLKLAPEG
jgi:hypothetical protein